MQRSVVSSVASKVWVTQYYRKNAGFFIIGAILLSGVFSGDSLYVLAGLAVNNPALLGGFFMLSFLYAVKTTRWGISVIRAAENSFLLQFRLVARSRQLNQFMQLQAGIFAPMWLFWFPLLQRSIQLNRMDSVLILLSCLLLMHLIPALIWIYFLQKPFDPHRTSGLEESRFLRKTGMAGWLLRHLLHKEPLLLAGTKLLSIFLVAGSVYLYQSDNYDHRLFSLAFTAAAFLHLGILEELSALENQLLFLRNLPASEIRRVSLSMLILLPVFLPEMLVFIRNCPPEMGWLYRISSPLFFMAMILFLYQLRSYFHQFPKRRDKILPVIFFIVSLTLMYQIPVAWLALLCLSASFLLNKTLYYETDFLFTSDEN